MPDSYLENTAHLYNLSANDSMKLIGYQYLRLYYCETNGYRKTPLPADGVQLQAVHHISGLPLGHVLHAKPDINTKIH